MADLTGAVSGGTGIGDNYLKNTISQSGVGEEVILKISSDQVITHPELNAMVAYLTTSHGSAGAGDSAHTIGGLGTADGTAFDPTADTIVYLRVQGTGDHDAGWVAAVKAAGEAVTPDTGATITVSIEAIFKPAK